MRRLAPWRLGARALVGIRALLGPRALIGMCALISVGALAALPGRYAAVTPQPRIHFPEDRGSHPDFRTEWWYVTGWLSTTSGETLGFQITFFRTKPPLGADNPSAFSPHQILIAHCAISDPAHGGLWQEQRTRRAGMGLADAAGEDTDVWLDDWRLRREADGYTAHVSAPELSFDIRLSDTQPPLLNGVDGYSRKGPAPESASYYYSVPHLRVQGRIGRGRRSDTVTGEAWFDHEWSSEYLDAGSIGWDWIGINLRGAGALMAFRIRGPGGTTRWSGGSYRDANGRTRILEPAEIDFEPVREWTSPRTAVRYPVEWQVRAGPLRLRLKPLLDDQENDTRSSTGAIYWEGAVRAFGGDAAADGHASGEIGRGYLELTGYGERLVLR